MAKHHKHHAKADNQSLEEGIEPTETTKDESLDDPIPELTDEEPQLTGMGTLHSVDKNEVRFVNAENTVIFDMAEDASATINDVPTTIHDLKRGDRVEVFGNPVVKINAVRK